MKRKRGNWQREAKDVLREERVRRGETRYGEAKGVRTEEREEGKKVKRYQDGRGKEEEKEEGSRVGETEEEEKGEVRERERGEERGDKDGKRGENCYLANTEGGLERER